MADIKALLFLLRKNTEGVQDEPSPAQYLADCGVHLKVFREVLWGQDSEGKDTCDCHRWGQIGVAGK
jgi:hypothetical protein